MNPQYLQRWLLVLFSVCLIAAASLGQAAEQTLEVVKLKNRAAEDVIPALQPLLEPGGALSGEGFTLFVRASPGNLAQLRQALDQLDRRPSQYLISVRNSTRQEIEREQLAAAVAVGTPGVRARIQATDDSTRQQGTAVSTVTVLEGNEAFITADQSRGGFGSGIRDASSGLTVRPRSLGDDRVLVEIDQQSRQRSSTSGRVASQSLTTQVSGKLGEWLELGGVQSSSSSSQSGILSRGRTANSDDRSVWIKVELSP